MTIQTILTSTPPTTTLSQRYIENCSKRSIKPNSSLVTYLAQFDNAPSHLTELDLSLTCYVGPQGLIPVIETVINTTQDPSSSLSSTSTITATTNIKSLNASDNRITNEIVEVLLDALLERFSSTAFFRQFFTITSQSSGTALSATSAGINNSVFEFNLDLSRNPISSAGGKKIVAFLAEVKANNESGKNRVPVVFSALNLENTLIVPSMLELIEEKVTNLRLGTKFGENIIDAAEVLGELEKIDNEHKEKVAEFDKKLEAERKEKLQKMEKEMMMAEEDVKQGKEAIVTEEHVVGYSELDGGEIQGRDRGDIGGGGGGIDFAAFGDGGMTEKKEEGGKQEEISVTVEERSGSGSRTQPFVVNNNSTSGIIENSSNIDKAKNTDKLTNVFVLTDLREGTWKGATAQDFSSSKISTETHVLYVKSSSSSLLPVRNENDVKNNNNTQQKNSSYPLAIQMGPFPALPLESYPKDQHEAILSDTKQFKQFWLPKTSVMEGVNNNTNDDEEEVTSDTSKPSNRMKNIWVGASVAASAVAPQQHQAPMKKMPMKGMPIPGKYRTYDDSDTEEDEEDSWYQRKKIAKKLPARKMKRRLS